MIPPPLPLWQKSQKRQRTELNNRKTETLIMIPPQDLHSCPSPPDLWEKLNLWRHKFSRGESFQWNSIQITVISPNILDNAKYYCRYIFPLWWWGKENKNIYQFGWKHIYWHVKKYMYDFQYWPKRMFLTIIKWGCKCHRKWHPGKCH